MASLYTYWQATTEKKSKEKKSAGKDAEKAARGTSDMTGTSSGDRRPFNRHVYLIGRRSDDLLFVFFSRCKWIKWRKDLTISFIF